MSDTPEAPRLDFIREIVTADQASNRHSGRVATRFPPEPNGYLHLGHAKSICLNFGVARDFAGTCNLRFDDTNPVTEDVEYVRSIQEDVQWLGFSWEDRLFYASDYFERLYACAGRTITARATPGACIRCTTTRTRCRMPSSASPTRCAPWNLKNIARSTTG
jgi:glutaminyl-tRNA synthetase